MTSLRSIGNSTAFTRLTSSIGIASDLKRDLKLWFASLPYSQSAFLRLALIFLASRLAILLISCIAFNNFQRELPDISWAVHFKNMWSKWDVGWYGKIAVDGYDKAPFSTAACKCWGFLPLYPLLSKGLMWICNTKMFFPIAASLSCLFTFSGLWILSHVLKERIQNINRFLFLYLVSAGSFYLSIPYSEGLALLLLACTFYFTQRKNYFSAAFMAGLGAITRIQLLGLLAIPLIPLLLDSENRKKALNSLIVIALFSLPTLVHMGYLNSLCGNPLAFFDMQDAWGNANPYPLEALFVFIRKGFQNPLSDWLHFFIWSLFGVLLIRNFKKIPLNEIVFCLIVFVISTGTEKFYGASRYVLMLIPLYIALANEEKWFCNFYIYSSLVIGTLYVASFTNNYILAI